jgi:chloride intracellular channel protein 2
MCRFLTRDNTPDHLDCAMLPKLQHIRVVSRIWKGFEMPHELTALWRYLDTCYNSDFFRQTCPSDQEIIHHWMNKPELGRLPKSAEALLNVGVPQKYSFDVPSGH